jgi:hypothetical protein
MAIPQIPPGHLAVLIERPHDVKHYLAGAATAVLTGEGDPASYIDKYNSDPDRSAESPPLDPSFGAVPIGPGEREVSFSARDYAPATSKMYLARAFLPAERVKGDNNRVDKGLVYSDPAIARMLTLTPPTCGTDPFVGNTAKVRQKLDTVTLRKHGLDGSGVAIAIVDSGIFQPRIRKLLGEKGGGRTVNFDGPNSWQLSTVTTKPGRHRLGHGTMCAYDALIAAPEATLLDFPILLARPPAVHTTGGTVAAAVLAYADIKNKWLNPGGAPPPYARLVVSNSWGILHPSLEDFGPNNPGRFIDNPNHAFRIYYIRPLTQQAKVDIIFCGNNCGPACPAATCLSKTDRMIMGANAYDEVLTVGGCDTHNDLVGYSSHGPSIANMPQQKPDITAYTHFLGSKARRIFRPDTGVSAACPVAAGCVAALRTKLPPTATPPNVLFDALRAKASTGNNSSTLGGTWNPQYGFGIINPVAAGKILGVIPP